MQIVLKHNGHDHGSRSRDWHAENEAPIAVKLENFTSMLRKPQIDACKIVASVKFETHCAH